MYPRGLLGAKNRGVELAGEHEQCSISVKGAESSKCDSCAAGGGGETPRSVPEQLNQIVELKGCQTPLLCRLK